MKKGEHKTPAFLAINPMGKLPTITHGGVPVTEVGAIAIYLADLFPEAKLAPAIGDTARGTYLRWIVFNHAAIEPAITDKARKIEGRFPSSTLCYGTYDDTVNALAGAVRNGPYILGRTIFRRRRGHRICRQMADALQAAARKAGIHKLRWSVSPAARHSNAQWPRTRNWCRRWRPDAGSAFRKRRISYAYDPPNRRCEIP